MKEKIIELFKIYKYYIIVGLVLIIILVIFLLFSKEETTYEPINLIVEDEVVVTSSKIQVDIKGAINKPGVYELEADSRVGDAIEASGGLTIDADTSMINLSKNLEDEMVIIIYTTAEIKEMRSGSTSVKYIENECICPSISNDACIDNIVSNNDGNKTETVTGKISINKGTLKDLMTLSGIGESKAKAIIAYREENGGFKTIEEITKVSGIGTSTFEKIKNDITL